MKRIEFLYRAATLASAWLPILFHKKKKSIEIYQGSIAGYRYYDGPEIEEIFYPGMPLRLRREPDNEHDNLAIEVYADTYKLGYIPRSDNQVLSRLMDRGIALKARIKEYRIGYSHWNWVEIGVELSQINDLTETTFASEI